MRSASPLGPFTYQEANPLLRKTTGVVPGTGHGCIVRGPRNTLWAFVTSVVGNYHVFERRIGLYPVGIDSAGQLFGPARCATGCCINPARAVRGSRRWTARPTGPTY